MAMQGMVSKQDGLHNSFKVQESSPGRRHLRKIAENVTKIKEDIALAKTPQIHSQQQEMKPQMPGTGGYFMRRVLAGYISMFLTTPTTNWNWSQKAFLFQSQSFFGTSPDNIQQCQYSDSCRNKVVEYKCP